MRINKFIAQNSKLSRRQADSAISEGRVKFNSELASLGNDVTDQDEVMLDGELIESTETEPTTILINKPVGYVCSRDGQGSPSIYTLIERKYHHLNIAGRLDKDSSGLVIMTDDGNLLYEITHPGNNKKKVYEVTINKTLKDTELKQLLDGVDIGDERPSKFTKVTRKSNNTYEIIIEEGRNRQIRRTYESLGLRVRKLHRTQIGDYKLENLKGSQLFIVDSTK